MDSVKLISVCVFWHQICTLKLFIPSVMQIVEIVCICYGSLFPPHNKNVKR